MPGNGSTIFDGTSAATRNAAEILYGEHSRDAGGTTDPTAEYLTADAARLEELLDHNQRRALVVLQTQGEQGTEKQALATHEFHPYLWSKAAPLSLSSDLLSELAARELVIAGRRSVGVGELDTWRISPAGERVIAVIGGKNA